MITRRSNHPDGVNGVRATIEYIIPSMKKEVVIEYYDKNFVRLNTKDIVTFALGVSVYKGEILCFDMTMDNPRDFRELKCVAKIAYSSEDCGDIIPVYNTVKLNLFPEEVVRCILPVYKDNFESYLEYRSLRNDYNEFIKSFSKIEEL